MNINLRFNKFYHSILNDLYKKSNSLIFRELLDTRTKGAFKIVKYEDYRDLDDLKQLLKLLNLNYETDTNKDNKVSTKDIENKQLLEHIEFIFLIATQNGVSLKIVEDEWNFLINYYKDK